jgi:hypothetical protein
MKVAQKRPLITFMQDSFQVTERRACRALPLIRSSCRRKSTLKDPVVLRHRPRNVSLSLEALRVRILLTGYRQWTLSRDALSGSRDGVSSISGTAKLRTPPRQSWGDSHWASVTVANHELTWPLIYS